MPSRQYDQMLARTRETPFAGVGAKLGAKQGKEDHIKWYCPCGQHIAVVTQARKLSAGVVADTITKLACLPVGWLQ